MQALKTILLLALGLVLPCCKGPTREIAATEAVAGSPTNSVNPVRKVFVRCSDAGYLGHQSLEIQRDLTGNGAVLIANLENLQNAEAGGESVTTTIGKIDGPEDQETLSRIFTFGALSFIVTLDPTKSGFYPGTLVGKDASGKDVNLNVFCTLV